MPTARGARSGGFSAFEKLVRPAAPADGAGPQDGGGAVVKAVASGRPPPPARELSVEETRTLLEGMRVAIVGLAFQKALDNVRSRDWGALKKRAGIAKLLSYAWKSPLKASGFAIDAYSFPRILAAVRSHASAPGIRSLSEEVEKLLKFFPGALFGSNAGRMKGTANNAALKEASGRGAFSKLSNGGVNGGTNGATNGGVNGGINGTTNGRTEAAAAAPAPAPSARPPSLRGRPMGLGEAKDILKRLKEEAAKQDFQEGLSDLSRSAPDLQRAVSSFVARKWAEAMRFYDFPVTPGGFKEMVDGIHRCDYNRHVSMLAHEVEEKLHIAKGSFFGIAAADDNEGEEEKAATGGAQDGRPGEVAILLRHNQLGTELTVNLRHDGTFYDLKEAAARLIGSSDIKTRGRLVRKNPGGTFVSYKDSDQVGAVREVLVLGAELTPSKGGDMQPAPPPKPATTLRLNVDDMTLTPARQQPSQEQQQSRTPELTKEQARQLLRELHSGFSDNNFQQKLKKFHSELGTTTQFSKERQRLALTVQSVVLPKYGLRGSVDGVLDMQMVIGPFIKDDIEMQKIASECDELLLANARVMKKKAPKTETADKKVQPEQQEASKAPTADPEPEPPARLEPQKPLVPAVEVYFVVRHALNERDEEVWLKAMSSATFLQIKHVLAAKLGRDEVRTKGRLVYRAEGGAGVWTDFPDEEELGRNRKVVHIMGVSMPSKQFALVVRHAIKDAGKVDLLVWSHWKFREVKEALASKLGRTDFNQVKFVFKPNGVNAQGAWAAFKDEEQVGGSRTELFVLGVDDLEPTPKAKAAMAQALGQKEKKEEKEEQQEAEEEPKPEGPNQAELAKKAAEDMEKKKTEEASRKAKEKKDKKIKEVKEEWERRESEEADRRAKEEAERKAKEEAQRKKKEEAERKAKEEQARLDEEKRAKEEAECKAREEAERLEKEEAARKAKEEAERKEREEADRRAKEEEERQEQEAARKAKEEAERREREEAERKAKEEAEQREREEAERKAKEEAERKAKEEVERREREEAERKAIAERERREKEEAERKAIAERERREKEEAEQRAIAEKEEAERRAKEEAERKAEAERLTAERKAKEESDRRAAAAKEEAERKAAEEERRRKEEESNMDLEELMERMEAREKAEEERKAKEEAERREREEAAEKAKEEEAAKKAKAEAERKAKEEQDRKAKQEASRKAKEDADRERKAKEAAAIKPKQGSSADAKAGPLKQGSSADAKAAPPVPAAPVVRLPHKQIVATMTVPGTPSMQPTDTDDPLWIVTGGENFNGILVRKGEGLDSKPFGQRLQTGARIQAMDIVGNRLHYKRLFGDGPDFGWVNIKLNEKVLVEPFELGEGIEYWNLGPKDTATLAKL